MINLLIKTGRVITLWFYKSDKKVAKPLVVGVSSLSFALFMGGLGILKSFFFFDLKKSILYSSMFLLILYGIIFVFVMFVTYRNEKKARRISEITAISLKKGYGEAIRELAIAFSVINEERLYREQKKLSNSEVLELLKPFTHCLSNVYTNKTDSQCAVSIKLIEGFDNRSTIIEKEVMTILRDDESEIHRGKDIVRRSAKHTIKNNTCFVKIARQYLSDESYIYFFQNDLISLNNYQNSTLQAKLDNRHDKEELKNKLESVDSREEVYKILGMEYRSEVVVPILPFSFKSHDECFLLGYLTIDSPKKNVFNEEYDIPLLKGVADGIYKLIYELKDI